MLFLGALGMDEIDENDGLLPDLKPKSLKREILKSLHGVFCRGGGGCGALNGDPDVKRCSLWIATPLAGKEMRILCDPSRGEFSMSFERVGCQFGRASTVADLKNRLHSIPKWINHI